MTRNDWIKASDRIPENIAVENAGYMSDYVLVLFENGGTALCTLRDTGDDRALVWVEEHYGWPRYRFEDVSHWMPLPEPPSE